MADPVPPTPRLVLDLGVPRWFWACAALGLVLWGLGSILRAAPAEPSAEQVLREQAVLDAARLVRQQAQRDSSALDSAIAATIARP